MRNKILAHEINHNYNRNKNLRVSATNPGYTGNINLFHGTKSRIQKRNTNLVGRT
jgi:hypothetical protein